MIQHSNKQENVVVNQARRRQRVQNKLEDEQFEDVEMEIIGAIEEEAESKIKNPKLANKPPKRVQQQPATKEDGHSRRPWNDVEAQGFVGKLNYKQSDDDDTAVEMNVSPNGNVYSKFTLKISQGKEKMSIFIQVTVWGELAEWCDEHIIVGSKIAIKGYLNQYKTQTNKYYTGITADVVKEID